MFFIPSMITAARFLGVFMPLRFPALKRESGRWEVFISDVLGMNVMLVLMIGALLLSFAFALLLFWCFCKQYCKGPIRLDGQGDWVGAILVFMDGISYIHPFFPYTESVARERRCGGAVGDVVES